MCSISRRQEVVLLEGGVYARAVETDYDLAVDIEYRDATLATFRNGCLGILGINLYIEVIVANAELVEIFFGGVAESTPGCAIDDNFRIIHAPSIALYVV